MLTRLRPRRGARAASPSNRRLRPEVQALEGRCLLSVLLQDNFNDNALDATKWTTVLPNIDGSPSITEQNGHLEISNGAHLVSTGNFDPSVVGPLTLTGTWTFHTASTIFQQQDYMEVFTRSDASADGPPYGNVQNGVGFIADFAQGNPSKMWINYRVNGPSFVLLAETPIQINNGDTLRFTITDDGTNISFALNDLTSGDSKTLNATVPTHFATNRIDFYNANQQTNPTPKVSYLDDVVVTSNQPDLAATQPTWNTTDHGVDFGYTISGSDLPHPPTIALYWASGMTADTAIGNPIATLTATKTAKDASESFHVAPAQLSTPPQGASLARYLLAVVNPPDSNHIPESDDPRDTNNAQPLALPDISLSSGRWLTLEEGGGVKLSYLVSGAAIPFDTRIVVYWSSTPDLDGRLGDVAATYDITTADQKAQDDATPKTFFLEHSQFVAGLQVPPDGATYLVVVADPASTLGPPGFGTIPESREDNNLGAIPITPLVLNVVTHGFKPFVLQTWSSFRAPWYEMATELNHVAAPGSILDGRIQTYVSQWDSSEGFLAGFADLLVAKLDDAAARLYRGLDRASEARRFAVRADELRHGITAAVATSRQHAEDAAWAIFQDITTNPVYGLAHPASVPDLLPSPPDEPNPRPHIDLIGHSRGAAVNARVSLLLSEAGYHVDQYTALDGFSTDWPTEGGRLGDISITGEATADIKVNYRVQDGLQEVILRYIDEYLRPRPRIIDFLPLPILSGHALTTQDKKLLKGLLKTTKPQRNWDRYKSFVEGANDLRAPERNTFLNKTLVPGTDHLSITGFFRATRTAGRFGEFYQNYAGEHASAM
jgi:hypothetical protein